jgi:hypothetical protein
MRRKGLISKSDYDLRLDAPKSILETEKPQKTLSSGQIYKKKQKKQKNKKTKKSPPAWFFVFLTGFFQPCLWRPPWLRAQHRRRCTAQPRSPTLQDKHKFYEFHHIRYTV